jgi:hypothetical protein
VAQDAVIDKMDVAFTFRGNKLPKLKGTAINDQVGCTIVALSRA